LLLDGKIAVSPDLEDASDTRNQARYELGHCVPAEEVGSVPESVFLRKEEVGLTLGHRGIGEAGGGVVLELPGQLCSAGGEGASPARSCRARLSRWAWATGRFSGQFWQKWIDKVPALLRRPRAPSRVWASVSPNLLGQGRGRIQKPGPKGDITETRRTHTFVIHVGT